MSYPGYIDDYRSSGVYLIHFCEPYKHARHYLGWSPNISKRLRAHRRGQGARLMEVVTAAGIPWHIARTWPGATRRDERRLKGHHRRHLCPICRQQDNPRPPTDIPF